MRKHFIEEEDLLLDAYRLGVQVFNSGFRPDFVVGLWRGGAAIGIAVHECLQHLGVEADHLVVHTTRRGGSTSSPTEAAPELAVHGSRYLEERLQPGGAVLLVDDVFCSARGAEALERRLRTSLEDGVPADIRLAAPWYKPGSRGTSRVPEYYLHETDRWLVFPYELNGLTLDEIRRHKPYLAGLMTRLTETKTRR